jgi:ribosome-associated toxin RatA of RatAB toxin-antitoxin module
VIRKFAQLNVSAAMLHSVFADVEGWPEWLPGVESVVVHDRSESLMVVEIDGYYMGQRMHSFFECRIDERSIVQHQTKGRLKRWDTHWRFFEPADGRGTTLGCEIEMDAGLIGALVPQRFTNRFIDRVFSDTVANLKRRVGELIASPSRSTEPEADTATLLEVFDTPIGYEVLVGGRRLNLERSD